MAAHFMRGPQDAFRIEGGQRAEFGLRGAIAFHATVGVCSIGRDDPAGNAARE
jgi:hypothetical protein